VPIRKALTVTLWTIALFRVRFLPARGGVSDFANVTDSYKQKRLTVMAQQLDHWTDARIRSRHHKSDPQSAWAAVPSPY
jgi:hypothetical protein